VNKERFENFVIEAVYRVQHVPALPVISAGLDAGSFEEFCGQVFEPSVTLHLLDRCN
jgi:hypothetical protein